MDNPVVHKLQADNLSLPVLEIVERDEWVTGYCRDKTVLHLGCADAFYTDNRLSNVSTLMHYRVAQVAKRVVGVDSSKTDLEKLGERWPEWELFIGDVEHLDQLRFDTQFDIALAGEIIEHLHNPGLFLRSVHQHLRPESGRLVITTPNHFGLRRFAHFLSGYEKCHPHHTCYYSYNTLKLILERSGYLTHQAFGYSSPPPANPFKKVLYMALESLPQKVVSSHACDGLIFVATPSEGTARNGH